MPKFIVKIKDSYFEWSTITGSPVTYAMDRKGMASYLTVRYGTSHDAEGRLKRVDKKGHSMFDSGSLEDLISFNRAGPDESSISIDEIYERYQSEESYESFAA